MADLNIRARVSFEKPLRELAQKVSIETCFAPDDLRAWLHSVQYRRSMAREHGLHESWPEHSDEMVLRIACELSVALGYGYPIDLWRAMQ